MLRDFLALLTRSQINNLLQIHLVVDKSVNSRLVDLSGVNQKVNGLSSSTINLQKQSQSLRSCGLSGSQVTARQDGKLPDCLFPYCLKIISFRWTDVIMIRGFVEALKQPNNQVNAPSLLSHSSGNTSITVFCCKT